MKKILVIGAASAIAHETEKLFAEEGVQMFLTDLKLSRLQSVKDDLLARNKNNKIDIKEFNALDFELHSDLFSNASEAMGGIDIVFIAHGSLPDQPLMQTDYLQAVEHFKINGLSVISLATLAGDYFDKQGSGTIAVISSVAGDRGRSSNYLYGSAKAAVSTFLSGLRNRLSAKGIKVVTIKPGMVDTPMTADIPKNFLFAKPKVVGKGIYDAINSGKDIAYVPGYWRLIMFVIKHIPEVIFKKMSL